jgi:hypothetical protein
VRERLGAHQALIVCVILHDPYLREEDASSATKQGGALTDLLALVSAFQVSQRVCTRTSFSSLRLLVPTAQVLMSLFAWTAARARDWNFRLYVTAWSTVLPAMIIDTHCKP